MPARAWSVGGHRGCGRRPGGGWLARSPSPVGGERACADCCGGRRPTGAAWSTSAGARRSPSWPSCSPAPRRSSSATPAPRTSPWPSGRRWCRCTPRRCRPVGGGPGVSLTCCSATRRSPAPAAAPGSCPVAGHPCVAGVTPGDVVAAVERLVVRPVVRAGVNIFLWHVHGSWTTALVQGRPPVLRAGRPGPLAVGTRDGRGRGRGPTRRSRSPMTEAAELDVDVVAAATARGAARAGGATGWAGDVPGVDVPAVYVEHNAPQGRINEMVHPTAAAPGVTVVHVTPFNDLFWDCGERPHPCHRARHRRPRRPLHGRAGQARRRRQRTGSARPGHGHRPAPPLRRRRPGRPVRHRQPGRRSAGIEDLPQAALHEAMAQRRVYVHPVRWTSLGLSLLEAMHLGMPVRRAGDDRGARGGPAGRRRRLDVGRRARRRRPPARRRPRGGPRHGQGGACRRPRPATGSPASSPTGTRCWRR